jgi:hypothetical protein
MRARWTGTAIARNRPADWAFSRTETLDMQQTIARTRIAATAAEATIARREPH